MPAELVTLPEDRFCTGMPRHVNRRLPLLNTCDTFRRMAKRKDSEEPAGSWVFRDLPGNFHDQDEDCRCGSEKICEAMSHYRAHKIVDALNLYHEYEHHDCSEREVPQHVQ